MAFIYKITNNINQKVYIGKTEGTIEKRFKEHCRASKRDENKNRPLYSAMRKYGVENFQVEEIEETDIPEEREKYWIKQYGSYGNGYNATLGGDGKKYVLEEEIIDLYKEGLTINKIAEVTKHDCHTISKILKNNNITIISGQERVRKTSGKPIVQVDLQGNFIAEFSSSGEAGKAIGKNRAHIGNCCNHKRKTAYGYKWLFSDEYYQ